jgi:hypothetical protein
LEQESKETKERSVAAVSSLENRVTELEGRLAVEQERSRRLQEEKEKSAKNSEAALSKLRHETARALRKTCSLGSLTWRQSWPKRRRR